MCTFWASGQALEKRGSGTILVTKIKGHTTDEQVQKGEAKKEHKDMIKLTKQQERNEESSRERGTQSSHNNRDGEVERESYIVETGETTRRPTRTRRRDDTDDSLMCMFVTLLTSQEDKSWLKALAVLNTWII